MSYRDLLPGLDAMTRTPPLSCHQEQAAGHCALDKKKQSSGMPARTRDLASRCLISCLRQIQVILYFFLRAAISNWVYLCFIYLFTWLHLPCGTPTSLVKRGLKGAGVSSCGPGLLFCPVACRILVPNQRSSTRGLALESILTTVPPEKSQVPHSRLRIQSNESHGYCCSA